MRMISRFMALLAAVSMIVGLHGSPALANTADGPLTATPVNGREYPGGLIDITSSVLAAVNNPSGRPLSIVSVSATNARFGFATLAQGTLTLQYTYLPGGTVSFTATVTDGTYFVDVPVTYQIASISFLKIKFKQRSFYPTNTPAKFKLLNRNDLPLKCIVRVDDYTQRKLFKGVIAPGASTKLLVTYGGSIRHICQPLRPAGEPVLLKYGENRNVSHG